jgi:two-component system CheB/CheR fusion protein
MRGSGPDEKRFRAMAEQAGVGMALTDLHGQVIWANDRQCQVMATERAELVGRPFGDLVSPADRAKSEALFRHLLTTGESFSSEKWIGRADEELRRLRLSVDPYRDNRGEITGAIIVTVDITDVSHAVQRQRFLLSELQHRVRNILAVIRSIIRRSEPSSASLTDYVIHLQGRIDAFARVQAAIIRDPTGGIDLERLITEELRAVGGLENATTSGPRIALNSKAAGTLCLVIHELATNAVEFGALGASYGRLAVSWWPAERSGGKTLLLTWDESGMEGLPAAPMRHGFGTEVLERTLAYDLGGESKLSYRPTGLFCRMELPLAELTATTGD